MFRVILQDLLQRQNVSKANKGINQNRTSLAWSTEKAQKVPPKQTASQEGKNPAKSHGKTRIPSLYILKKGQTQHFITE